MVVSSEAVVRNRDCADFVVGLKELPGGWQAEYAA
jgi:hypothetical protein